MPPYAGDVANYCCSARIRRDVYRLLLCVHVVYVCMGVHSVCMWCMFAWECIASVAFLAVAFLGMSV